MGALWMRVRSSGTYAWQSAAIAAAAVALVFAIAHATAFSDVRAWTYDFTVLHAGLSAPSKDIVLVDFDEDTFNRIAQYPIPRFAVAEVVSRIGAQKPRVIGMDVFLSEPRTPVEDKAMQTALTEAGVVIVASQSSVGILPPVTPLPMFCQPEDAHASSGFCVEGAPGALGYAFVNLPIDGDGFIRQANLFAAGTPPSLSFPLSLAQQYTGEPIKPVDANRASFNGHTVYYADRELKTILIGSWGHEPVTAIPAWKLLAGEIPANTFTDKLVLIGQSNDAAHDRDFTPLFRSPAKNGERLRMSGTQIQGAIIRTLLEGTSVRPASNLLLWSTVFLVCWLASFLLLKLRTTLGVGAALVLLLLPGFVGLFLFARLRFWLPFLPAQTGVALTLPLTLGVQFVAERIIAREAHQQRKEMMKLFSSYVDPAVADTIWQRRSEVSLAGEERIATVMFTDIRSFTSLSFGKPPAEILRWLNQYLTAMDEVIRQYDGFLNKFIGDGLMIIFGLPLGHGDREDARRAVEASLAMLARVEQLNRENAADPSRPQLRIGVGIHSGPLMAGSIGSAARQEYSVIGETVNLASRLESLNKPFKTEILFSEATRTLLGDDFAGPVSLGEAKVPGLDDPVVVYTIYPTETPSMHRSPGGSA